MICLLSMTKPNTVSHSPVYTVYIQYISCIYFVYAVIFDTMLAGIPIHFRPLIHTGDASEELKAFVQRKKERWVTTEVEWDSSTILSDDPVSSSSAPQATSSSTAQNTYSSLATRNTSSTATQATLHSFFTPSHKPKPKRKSCFKSSESK